MQLRLSLSFFVVMLLGACSSVVSHSIFSVPEVDFSIEYPQGWVVEGGRPASELFAIHRPFSFGEELTPSNAIYFWLVRQELHPSLDEFVLSQKSDLVNTTCDTPSKTLIGRKKYAGIHMSCSNGTEHFYLEASNHYLAVGFDAKSPDAPIFSRMKDSMRVSLAR